MEKADVRTLLLLSVQRALLDVVAPSLRAVTCGWERTEVQLRFIFDGEIDPKDIETAQIVGTEVIADFPSPWTISEEFVRLDAPDRLEGNALSDWVYRRKEPAKHSPP